MAEPRITDEGGNFVRFELVEGDGITDEFLNGVLRDALEEAIELAAEDSREILNRHRSEKTGTGQFQTNPHPPPALADRIRSYAYFLPDGTASAGFGLDGDVAYIGWFLEYGWQQVLWGQHTNMETGPYPYLRPAYERNRRRIVDLVKKRVRQALRRREIPKAA